MKFDELLRAPVAAAPLRKSGIVVGGMPAVTLLPRELRHAARDRLVRFVLAAALVGIAVLTGVLVALALATAGAAQTRSASEGARSQALAQRIAALRQVSELEREVTLGDAAVRVGTSTQIDWQSAVDALAQYLPAGFTLTGIDADSATVTAAYLQGTSPLEPPRAATVVLTATGDDLSGVPRWLRTIRAVPGYADATPSITATEGTGYTVVVTVHLSAKAIDAQAWKEWVK